MPLALILGYGLIYIVSHALDDIRDLIFSSVQERALQAHDGADVPGHPAMNTAVQRIPDDRMTDGAQVHSNLMRSTRPNLDLQQ